MEMLVEQQMKKTQFTADAGNDSLMFIMPSSIIASPEHDGAGDNLI
jgi:hypothetical protein